MSYNLAIISQNKGKIAELKELLTIPDLHISVAQQDLVEIQELDILQIAEYKLQQVSAEIINGYDFLVVDDTALEIAALKGLPGTLIKWFLQTIGTEGIINMVPKDNTVARAICVLGLFDCKADKRFFFRGEVVGSIVDVAGEGFGFDRLFKPLHSEISYGQMSFMQKNKCSHRAMAARNLRRYLLSQLHPRETNS